MAVPAVSLLSRDPGLAQSVGAIVAGMENLRLHTGDTLAAARLRLQRQESIALLLYDLVAGDGIEEAAQLLEVVVAAKRPVATIILC